MPRPQPFDIKTALFRLRWHVGFYDEFGKDIFPQFLDSLRPYVTADERLVVALLKYDAFGDLYTDGRVVLEFLLGALPDSPQPGFILNYFAFQPLGEDGMSTESAHRIMWERCPDDLWFHRQVVQFARGRHLGLGYSGAYYHSDLSDSDGKLLLRWALDNPAYVSRCFYGFSLDEVLLMLSRYPDFPIDDYDLTGPLGCVPRLIAEARTLSSEDERVAFFAKCKEVDDFGRQRLVDALVKELSPQKALLLCAIANGPPAPETNWARLQLLRNASQSPIALEWTKKHLASQSDERWWLSMLVNNAPDPGWVLEAIGKLASQVNDFTHKYDIPLGLLRLCNQLPRLPADQIVPLLKQSLLECSPEHRSSLSLALARAYPNHPETRTILLAQGALKALRLIDGLSPNLVHLAIDQAKRDPSTGGSISILRDAKTDAAFRTLIDLFKQSPNDVVKAEALRALAEGYTEQPEVKSLLIRSATADENNDSLWQPAVFALGTLYPKDPEARETLEKLAGSAQRQSFRSKEVLDYLADPDHSLWLANRAKHRAELNAKFAEITGDTWESQNAAYGLALWFGDERETMDLLLGSVSTELQEKVREVNDASWQAERVTKAKRELAVYCLRVAVMRWRDSAEVHRAVIAALQSPVTELRDEAACLLSRAWSKAPETIPLLCPLIGKSPVIFGEYIGLRLNEPAGMAEGLRALELLSGGETDDRLALDGPLHLLRHFGPRKDLFGSLCRLAATTAYPKLQKGISKALDTFFPGRKPKSLNAEIATDRIEALQSADIHGVDLNVVLAMSASDPSDAVRLAAAEAIFARAAKQVWPVESVKDLIARGFYEAIPLLGRMCAGDDAVLGWLLKVTSANQASGDLEPGDLLTSTVGQSFVQTPAGRDYLAQRLQHTHAIPEFSNAVRALCALYPDQQTVRSLLDSLFLDPRLDGPTAGHLLKTRAAQLSVSEKIDFYFGVLNASRPAQPCEAQRLAPMKLSALIACECHGEIPFKAPEAKKIVDGLIEAMENHPLETIRQHAMFALLTALCGETGKELQTRSKIYPEANEALNRWWSKDQKKV